MPSFAGSSRARRRCPSRSRRTHVLSRGLPSALSSRDSIAMVRGSRGAGRARIRRGASFVASSGTAQPAGLAHTFAVSEPPVGEIEPLGRTVVIADDDLLLREGVASLLTQAGYSVLGQVGDATELLELVRAHQPGLVIVDIRMPPDYGTEGLRAA